MIESTLTKAARSMHGRVTGPDVRFRGVSTDTRTIAAGQLFVALRGPNFDGNQFVGVAAERKAAAAVVNGIVSADLPLISVEDTRVALGQLAADWRGQMSATVVGITGSNGKTTLKEMVASCLAGVAATLATEGNLNNDIGVPLMLLRLSPEHRYAVMEMGANHAGEIAYLTSLTKPDVVVITNAGPAHLEGFGSVEGVARAKGEILQDKARPKRAVLNANDAYFDYWRSVCGETPITSFGLTPMADVTADNVTVRSGGSSFTLIVGRDAVDVDLPLPGEHNVRNACAAAAVCVALGLDAESIRRGLQSVAPVAARLKMLAGLRGARLYDDSYNANPASVEAAARFLAAQDGESILVLGDMGELGADSEALHRAAGEAAKNAGVDCLLATGELSRHAVEGFGPGALWYPSIETLEKGLRSLMSGDSNVLVKGSRAMHMGRIVRAVMQEESEVRSA